MIHTSSIQRARADAVTWANYVLQNPESLVILDTETTGFSKSAQVIQVGVVDGAGNVLIDNALILPTVDIDPEAEKVHRITHAKLVQEGTGFYNVFPILQKAIAGKILVVYNLDFDLRLIKQTALAHGMDLSYLVSSAELSSMSNDVLLRTRLFFLGMYCAMQKYAEWFGEFNQKSGKFRPHPLPGGDHTAVGDCLAVLKLIKRMAGKE